VVWLPVKHDNAERIVTAKAAKAAKEGKRIGAKLSLLPH
jgi:hypothetical protein